MGYSIHDMASAVIGDAHYTYLVNDEGQACIAKCSCASNCVHIPETLNGCPVTMIGESAFAKQSHLVNVTCPRALRHICNRAFEGCLKLRSITLNTGLESIGEEAFFLCGELEQLNVPSTVEKFGPHPLGTTRLSLARSHSPFEIRFSPDSDKLFFDEHGVLYERCEDGLVLIDGSGFKGETLVCNAETVEIGTRALSRMASLRHVVLPFGLKRICSDAFRGSTNLAHIDMPETLESIGEAAFSSTGLVSLHIPQHCTSIGYSAFALGSIAADGSICTYGSHLESITVHPLNPRYFIHGGLLCERTDDGRIISLLAPREAEEITLDESLSLVCDTTFAGTKHIGTLSIAEGTILESYEAIPRACAIDRVVVPASSVCGQNVSLRMPAQALSWKTHGGRFSSDKFLDAYDKAVSKVPDGWEQAKFIVERLAQPRGMSSKAHERFVTFVQAQLSSICIAYGQRDEFEGFDHLADAGILNADNIASLIESLSASGNSRAAGYLLAMKQNRFGAASWDDYEL